MRADLGELDHDDIPSGDGYPQRMEWVENVFFPTDGSAEPGVYSFFVHNYDGIFPGDGSLDNWQLLVLLEDTVLQTYTGLLSHDEKSMTYTYNFQP